MCGIGGVINANGAAIKLEEILTGLARDLHHRGPDDSGVLLTEHGATGLVGTRLAIQDLSGAGHQPMTSEDGRYHIILDRKSTRLNSSHSQISYAVFCL